MIEAISAVSGGLSILQAAIQFAGIVRNIAGAGMISAYFQWDGTRVEGDEAISVERHPSDGSDAVWWFSVKEVPEYTFIRMSVIESCAYELVGCVAGEENPDVRYWRWVAPEKPGIIRDGKYEPPNLKVDFVVVGYQPKALIKHFTS